MTLPAARRLFVSGVAIIMGWGGAPLWARTQSPGGVPRLKPISMEGDPSTGERLYLVRCWACHGLTGNGQGPASSGMQPPPPDFTLPDAFAQKSDSALLDAVMKGKSGTSMYPQQVDPQSAVDLLAFLKTLPRTPEREKGLLDALSRADKEAGRGLYNRRCWPCHGASGRGNGPAAPALRPPPADFTDPERVTLRTAARLYAVLSRGIPGTAMAAQALSEKEKFDLISYIRGLVRYAEDSKSPSEPVPPGDPRKGKETFEKRCWACHGSTGGGDGPAGADMIPAPTRFSDFEAMKQRSDQDWYNAIESGIPGTAMYAQRLSGPEILDLIAYLRSLGRRPAGASAP